MKKLILLNFIWFSIFSYTQTKERENRLVGSWQGSEKGNQEGVAKYWVQQRYNDGTFLLLFVAVPDGEEGSAVVDKGEWWTEDGKFYELHYNTKFIDTYFYEILDDQHVKFRLVQSSRDFNNSEYEFIDTKLIDGLDYHNSRD
ncbi:MAG: hypothetical protein M3Z80_01395 [Apibacter sp.]|uniref:hypothetical protein n=1 Tax=Apibacter sp. TaxID=2023709 RepID=UPI0025EF9554|nr:hypothetical protein [Apibacter sp.]MCT6868588.1 hypothetical protein [Apibacter sp.]